MNCPYDGGIIDRNDAMNMIWHHNEFIQLAICIMLRNFLPTIERNLAYGG